VNVVTEVLMLNASWEPLRLVSLKKAIVLLLQDKAELVEAAEQRLRAQHVALDVPLVIRPVRYVSIQPGPTRWPVRFVTDHLPLKRERGGMLHDRATKRLHRLDKVLGHFTLLVSQVAGRMLHHTATCDL